MTINCKFHLFIIEPKFTTRVEFYKTMRNLRNVREKSLHIWNKLSQLNIHTFIGLESE